MVDLTDAPDYDIVSSSVKMPYRERPYEEFTFTDPLLTGYKAIVAEDSKSPVGDNLTTFIIRFPRAVLSEINTHRVFSRNSASSRARSIRSTIRGVMTEPYIPAFTVNQRGMSGKFMNASDQELHQKAYLRTRDRAVKGVLELMVGEGDDIIAENYEAVVDRYYETIYNSGGVSPHKQNLNRILEPFMWHESVVTSRHWENFYNLRDDLEHADPAVYAIARLMRAASEASEPGSHSLHLPFVDEVERDSAETWSFEEAYPLLMRSATEAAQVSYADKASQSRSTATVKLGEKLLSLGHMSPFEHVAYRGQDHDFPSNLSPNWIQLRTILESGQKEQINVSRY